MNCLLIGGIADGAVVDVRGDPYFFHIARLPDSQWEIWDDEMAFKERPPLKVCYIRNVFVDDFVIYIEQSLTVRHAAAGLMMAYSRCAEQGIQLLDDKTNSQITAGGLHRAAYHRRNQEEMRRAAANPVPKVEYDDRD